jgi:RNA polymerase sigma factor (sigma-70 family)
VRQGIGRDPVKTNFPTLFTRRRAANDGPAPSSPSPGAGDVRRFQHSILPHLDGAYNLARFLTRDPVLSEDVVQDAVLRAFRAFGQFRGGSERAWLFAIVRNCARSAMTGAGGGLASLVIQESGLSEDARLQLNQHPDPGPTPEEEMLRKADIGRLHAAIEAIPEPFRETIVLRDLEGLSYAEIATVTGVAIGTVMSRLSRGRSMLAKELLPARNGDGEQSRSMK